MTPRDALETIARFHADEGSSQGWMAGGYGVIDHCCGVCGSFGEYGEVWPCPTYLAAKAGLDSMSA